MPTKVLQGLAIVLVHPFEISREGIGALFKQHGISRVSLFDSVQSFLDKHINSADIVLIHHSLYADNEIINTIIEKTGARVTLLASMDTFNKDSYDDIYNKMMSGVTGFLDVDESVYTFFSELVDIAAGDIVISSKFASNIRRKTDIIDGKLDQNLSERELQILDLVSSGNTNKEIALQLNISAHTVKGHLTHILTKLDLKNRQQAVAYIMRQRLASENT